MEDLQLEGGQLGGFLLFSIELFEAGLEAVGEVKFNEPSGSGPVDQGEPFNTSKLTNVVADQGGTKGKAVASNPKIVAANRSTKALESCGLLSVVVADGLPFRIEHRNLP